MSDQAQFLLKSIFGYDEFRAGQSEIIAAVLAGRDVLAIMPTGGGKSLCFQLPALCAGGVTVVISPLIALMRDQVRALQSLGVAAGALTSGNTADETDAVFQALEEGQLKLLYMAPERLALPGTSALLKRADVRLIAVDEAHCVSQWGHDFRPDYLRIGDLRRVLDVPLAAFTATADAQTRAEIITRLFPKTAPQVFLRGFDRPNIHMGFAIKNNPRGQLLDFVSRRAGLAGIVYCATRAKTATLAQALLEAGHAACAYHGGMEAEERRLVEERFQREDGLIVCATVAFGMGIDKPDIRWVLHADLPKTIEGYYQEIGRAGRDGAPAEAFALYGPEDIRLRRTQIDEGAAPDDRKAQDHSRLNALLGLAEATVCRRQILLGYFGETIPPCGHCDLCLNPPKLFDGTMAVRKALSAVLRTGEWFGQTYLIDVLLGQKTPRIVQNRHDALPTFGVGRDLAKSVWAGVFRQMMGHDLLRPDPTRFGALRLMENARPILRGEAGITLRDDTLKPPVAPMAAPLVDDDLAPLLAALKAKRRALAEAAKLPAYVIFHDKTLIEMAEKRPQNPDQMAQISGVGARKLARYGAEFLAVITGHTPQMHPQRQRLAGRPAGDLYDRLLAAQQELARGQDGLQKPLSLTPATLRRIAERRPNTLADLDKTGALGAARLERFGVAFLEIIEEG